jgi:hypothetical protein
MEKYARAIQEVQKDMGIKTTSFPHLGLYGDVFVLNNRQGERIVFEDHSALKAQQDENDKWESERAENAKKIQQELQKPEKEKQEELQTFADDVGPSYIEEKDEDDDEEEEEVPEQLEPEEVPEQLEPEEVPEQLEPDEEEGETVITMTDDIPIKSEDKN